MSYSRSILSRKSVKCAQKERKSGARNINERHVRHPWLGRRRRHRTFFPRMPQWNLKNRWLIRIPASTSLREVGQRQLKIGQIREPHSPKIRRRQIVTAILYTAARGYNGLSNSCQPVGIFRDERNQEGCRRLNKEKITIMEDLQYRLQYRHTVGIVERPTLDGHLWWMKKKKAYKSTLKIYQLTTTVERN